MTEAKLIQLEQLIRNSGGTYHSWLDETGEWHVQASGRTATVDDVKAIAVAVGVTATTNRAEFV